MGRGEGATEFSGEAGEAMKYYWLRGWTNDGEDGFICVALVFALYGGGVLGGAHGPRPLDFW